MRIRTSKELSESELPLRELLWAVEAGGSLCLRDWQNPRSMVASMELGAIAFLLTEDNRHDAASLSQYLDVHFHLINNTQIQMKIKRHEISTIRFDLNVKIIC